MGKGIIWNLKGDEEDFSFVLKSVGEGELLPSKNQELSFSILNLLNTKNEFKTIREIASETSSNEEHTRRVCKNLFLEKEIFQKAEGLPGSMGLRLFLHVGYSKKRIF